MASGLPLGIVEEQQFETHQLDLQCGDTLVLYTDGVTEAANKKLQQSGVNKFTQNVFLGTSRQRADTMKECIMKDVRGFIGITNDR